ncbi:MAG: ATP-binding protein [Holophagales bacterium]|nr:ATP-binding protein [Holophagales bacterium]
MRVVPFVASLRMRLVASMAAVLGLAVLATALASGWAIRVEVKQHLRMDSEMEERIDRELESAASALRGGLGVASTGGGAHGAAELEAWAGRNPDRGHDMVLLGPGGSILATSEPDLLDFRAVVRADGVLQMERRPMAGTDDGGKSFELRVPLRVIHEPGADRERRLYPIPRSPALLGHPSPEVGPDGDLDPAGRGQSRHLVAATDRRILLAATAVAALALATLWTLGRRLLGPIEKLTRAVRRLERGERGLRSGFDGHDEIAHLGRAFDRMSMTLERTEGLRRKLVADTAHELRTPLTNLRCQVEALRDGLMPIENASLSSLHDDVIHLENLVDELQDLAMAEAGQLRLERRRSSLRPLLLDAARAGRGPGQAAIEVRVGEGPGRPSLEAIFDSRRLRQVLDNLLSNALRHTPADGRVVLEARPASHDGVEISVTDTGKGIPPEHLDQVFERFFRVDPSRQRATGGAGLGLAIARHLVRLHGGELELESPVRGKGGSEQAGTRARFFLPPLRVDQLPGEGPPAAGPDSAGFTGDDSAAGGCSDGRSSAEGSSAERS